MIMECLMVGVGGFAGSVLRYLLGQMFPQGDWPWTTFAINVAGSFCLALIAGLVAKGVITDERLSLLLRVGLCGGFTTFSTLTVEAMGMMSDGRAIAGVAYVLASCCMGVGAAMAGSVAAGA